MAREAAELVLKDLKCQGEEIKQGLRELRGVVSQDEPSDESLETFRNGYQEVLRREVELSVGPVKTDMLQNATEFNMKLQSMIQEREQMLLHEQAYAGKLQDIVKSLEDRIATAREALTRSEADGRAGDEQITPQQVKLAREKVFKVVKEAMTRVIKASYGDKAADVLLVLRELLNEQGTPKEYIDITTQNYAIVNMLKLAHIVSVNPYKDTQIKLAFD